MKVFISHSSKDKWAARRIAEDLANLGADTFLDEKDISTGARVDDSIQEHLSDCDDFLLLLSPASIKSDWVLVELGGAIALKKRLVPVLLYIGANEIPSPITKHLACDINDIDRYYGEVKRRIEGGVPVALPKPTKKARKTRPKKPAVRLKKDDRVRIADSRQPDRQAKGKSVKINWVESMDQYCGKEATVTFTDHDRTLHIDIDDGQFWWAFEWLTKVDAS